MILNIRNQTCHLLPERALFWEEQNTLILADIHIGKATVFRKAGIPIPDGHMEEDLLKISALIKKMNAKKCIVVGDLIHAKSGLSEDVRRQFRDWLQDIDCEVHLILGNHDHSLAKSLPEEWSLHLHHEALLMGPFYFSHFPTDHESAFVWSGHLHPKVAIKNRHDQLVLRCFQISDKQGILPAFGSFVGGTFVHKSAEHDIYVLAGPSIIKL